MLTSELFALGGLVVAAVAMLLVTQSKERVAWPAWLVPAAVLVPFAVWSGLAIAEEGLPGLFQTLMGSPWGLQVWFDRLIGVTAAFFLLQNRARAAGMKSEVWVIAVIFTGSIGLLAMLARTIYIERKRAIESRQGI